MRKTSLINSFAILAMFTIMGGLSSCSKVLQGLKYNLGMQTQTVTVTVPVTPAGNITLPSVTTVYNVDSFIKANTTNLLGVKNISSVKLASCVLELDSTADAQNNFANFKSVTGSFYSNSNSTPYVLTIANNPDVQANSISLPVDDTKELKSYLGDQFTYDISGELRHPVTHTLTCKITLSYTLIVQG